MGEEVGSHNVNYVIAADGSDVFLTSKTFPGVRRVTGSTETLLATVPYASTLSRPLVSGSYVYFGAAGQDETTTSSKIFRVPRASGPSKVVAAGGWTEGAPGISRVYVAGCSSRMPSRIFRCENRG